MKIFNVLYECLDRYRIKLEIVKRIMESENKLATMSSFDFLFAFKPVAKDLSECTVYPYEYYLEEAQRMFREGKEAVDVLWHYDSMLSNMKDGDQ